MNERIKIQWEYFVATDLIPKDHLVINHCYVNSEHKTLCGIRWDDVLILRSGTINCPKCLENAKMQNRHI